MRCTPVRYTPMRCTPVTYTTLTMQHAHGS
jgi:hypothetical protein